MGGCRGGEANGEGHCIEFGDVVGVGSGGRVVSGMLLRSTVHWYM